MSVGFEDLAAENPEKLLFVIGGEDKGVGQFILNNSDSVPALPQSGKINSLNPSVAAGIVMFFLGKRS
ncbi:MAG: TrmH family RNA methyltransferase [Opitutales bacterium]